MTSLRAICVSALLASAVYVTALRNEWALDDHGLIERNPAAHSLGAAARAAFSPYWPPEGDFSAGLYRPVTTMTYAVDWTLSGGRPFWFHFTNLVLHAIATALAVAVVLRWLTPVAALAAGVVMAVQPVHVEAVANVIGRAEMLVAIGVLGAVLTARRYRRSESNGGRAAWLAATLAAMVLALGSKENGVVAPFVIAVDQALDQPGLRRRGWNLYVAMGAVTVAWLFVWRAVAGHLVEAGAVVPLKDLSLTQRLATVLPVQLEVLRLLVWPMQLAADYNPQTIPLRAAWSGAALLALVVTASVIALAVALGRRAPAITFGVLAGSATYLPTSNLWFTSGVILAERSLYVFALAPAVAVGWLVERAWNTPRRGVVLGSLGLVCLAFAERTISRIPFWRDSRSVVVQGLIEHPENFSNHIRIADAFLQTGDSGRALAEYLTAFEIYDGYSFVPVRAGQLALGMGRTSLALSLGRRARAIAPGHPGTARFVADVFLSLGQTDSALAVTREAVERNRGNPSALDTYVGLINRVDAPAWQRQLAQARLDWLHGHLVAASSQIEDAEQHGNWGASAGQCWELEQSRDMLRMLAPADTVRLGMCR